MRATERCSKRCASTSDTSQSFAIVLEARPAQSTFGDHDIHGRRADASRQSKLDAVQREGDDGAAIRELHGGSQEGRKPGLLLRHRGARLPLRGPGAACEQCATLYPVAGAPFSYPRARASASSRAIPIR